MTQTRPRARFDPQLVGYYEKAGWEAYYDRQWLRVLWLMVALNHAQFGMAWPNAVWAARDVVRASVAFAPLENDLAATKRWLTRFYAQARHAVGIQADADTLAALELEYWVVHRRLARARSAGVGGDIGPMVDSLAALHAALFDSTRERMLVSAQLRALAAAAVDEITSRRSRDVAADWQRIEGYLMQSYQAAQVMR